MHRDQNYKMAKKNERKSEFFVCFSLKSGPIHTLLELSAVLEPMHDSSNWPSLDPQHKQFVLIVIKFNLKFP